MDINTTVKEKLSAIGEDFDMLKPFMQKWVLSVEEAIQERMSAQAEAISSLKGVDYSVKSISASVGASRTTMYNHEQLLKRYIEYSAKVASEQSPYTEITRLQEEKSLLQEQIRKFMERDVDAELLKMQVRSLGATLEGKNAEIKRLESRIAELSEENRVLKLSGKQSSAHYTGTPFKKH